MTPETIVIRILQSVVPILTGLMVYAIILAIKGNIEKHQKVASLLMVLTFVGVSGLLITVAMGFDYTSLKDPLLGWGPDSIHQRLTIHRCFSGPLTLALCYTLYTGITKKRKSHRLAANITVFFWIGTLTTAVIFF